MARRDERIKMARPVGPEAVRTTIVGGRPPGGGANVGAIPRGVEVLIKKAAVDPAFKKMLLVKRAAAADAIALKLEPAEAAMLAAVPEAQLKAIVANTKVSPGLRPAFLGYAAAAMLAALAATGCKNSAPENTPYPPPSTGINPDIPETAETAATAGEGLSPGGDNTATPKDTKSGSADAATEAPQGLCFGARADLPPRAKGEALSVKKKGGAAVRLIDSTPTSITGSGADHPKRSPDVIGTVFRRHLSGVSGAYRSALKKNPALAFGTIEVIITIDSNGIIRSASIVSDDIGDEFLNSTILSRIRSWRFPPIEQGDVTVKYPFVFVAEGE